MKYSDVKVGDLFIVSSRYSQSLYRVTKVTPKRFKVGGYFFQKDNGCQVGGDALSRISLEIATDEKIAQIKLAKRISKLVREISETRFEKLTIEALEKIHLIVLSEANDANKTNY